MDEEKPMFKKVSKKKAVLRRPIRPESSSESEDEIENIAEKIEEMKSIQKLRTRPNGIELSTLMVEEKESVDETPQRDSFKLKTGGLVDMNSLKDHLSNNDDAYDTGIGTQFSAETNKRDEDDEMLKYIEEQLSKRKKNQEEDESESGNARGRHSDFLSPEEAALQSLPEHLKVSSIRHSEEMLSNQMLSGIPEIDLGIEAKIKNIEATEEAKLKLMRERQNKTDGQPSFVPTNMAVNFVQHNRFNIEDGSATKTEKDEILRKKKLEKRPLEKEQKATDDYHYERFKKQFRRY
ncbi:splicing factor C9orf78 homolog [Planococcus citri]|uniref:splicing factor C9orf78 homolog n=1 Tax=Planococcus citri TaxID=170843 RepID=UPI0031F76195